MCAVSDAVLGIVADIPALSLEARAVLPRSPGPAHSEAALHEFLMTARRAYGGLPHSVVLTYEAALDSTAWLGAVAWRLFTTETDDLNDATEVVCIMTTFLSDLREMGLAVEDAADLLMSAIAEDLGESRE